LNTNRLASAALANADECLGARAAARLPGRPTLHAGLSLAGQVSGVADVPRLAWLTKAAGAHRIISIAFTPGGVATRLLSGIVALPLAGFRIPIAAGVVSD
jgi:hypothetical protein